MIIIMIICNNNTFRALPCFVSVTAPFLTGIPTYMLTNIYW